MRNYRAYSSRYGIEAITSSTLARMAGAKETIDDLLTSLKDRFTNPLAFSYLCSWLVINWRVVLALFWNEAVEGEVRASGGLIAFVAGQFSWCRSFWMPLFAGVLLVLLLPLGRAALQMFYAYVNREATNRVLGIKGEGMISVRSYLRLREDYRGRTERLMEIVQQDTEAAGERARLDAQIVELERSKIAIAKDLQQVDSLYKKTTDIGVLDGWWRNDYVDNGGRTGVEIVVIDGGKYSINEEVSGGAPILRHVFTIVGFSYNQSSKRVTFTKELVPEAKVRRPPHEHFAFNDLSFNGDESTMYGTENRIVKITYTRIKGR